MKKMQPSIVKQYLNFEYYEKDHTNPSKAQVKTILKLVENQMQIVLARFTASQKVDISNNGKTIIENVGEGGC